eukprot:Transcript_32256.p1 GENE.Transcript_32256~~Transcript_32256.p1  ORF type:complete len:488 (-),score=125.70 Transcript_32256:448-1911(-)
MTRASLVLRLLGRMRPPARRRAGWALDSFAHPNPPSPHPSSTMYKAAAASLGVTSRAPLPSRPLAAPPPALPVTRRQALRRRLPRPQPPPSRPPRSRRGAAGPPPKLSALRAAAAGTGMAGMGPNMGMQGMGGAMGPGGMPMAMMPMMGQRAGVPMHPTFGGGGGGGRGGGEAPTRAVFFPSLPADVGYEELCDAVGAFGPIESIKIVVDKAQAHINFVDVGSAYQLILATGSHVVLQGKPTLMQWGRSRPVVRELMTAIRNGATRNLYVANVGESVEEAQLTAVFQPFGDLESVRLVPKKRAAFVNFTSISAAMRAGGGKDGVHCRQPLPPEPGEPEPSKPFMINFTSSQQNCMRARGGGGMGGLRPDGRGPDGRGGRGGRMMGERGGRYGGGGGGGGARGMERDAGGYAGVMHGPPDGMRGGYAGVRGGRGGNMMMGGMPGGMGGGMPGGAGGMGMQQGMRPGMPPQQGYGQPQQGYGQQMGGWQ